MAFLERWAPTIILMLVLIGIFVFFAYMFMKKTRVVKTTKPFNIDVAKKLYEALGESNVLSCSLEHQRLKVRVSSLKRVNREKLKETHFPAAVKGKEITLFVRYYPEDMYQYVDSKVKGA